jgi:RND family efflux transporter MFP subunit
VRPYFFVGFALAMTGLSAQALPPARQPLAHQVSCVVLPGQQVMVASSSPGIARSVLVQRGQFVRKGQPLLRVGSEMESAQKRLAATKAEAARQKLQRFSDAIEQQLISELERDQLQAEARLAQQEFEIASRAVQQKTTFSPISGVVANRKVEPGQYVGTEPAFELAALSPLRVELVFKGKAFGTIRRGSKINVLLGAPVAGIRQGTVTIVDRSLDARSGTFGVRVMLPNPGLKIPSGVPCKAST